MLDHNFAIASCNIIAENVKVVCSLFMVCNTTKKYSFTQELSQLFYRHKKSPHVWRLFNSMKKTQQESTYSVTKLVIFSRFSAVADDCVN